MYQSRTKSPEIIIPMWRDARSPPQNLRGCRKERERFGTLPHNWVQTASLSSRKQYISCQKPKKTSRIPFFSLLLISFQPSSIRDPWLSKCNPYIADPQSPHSTKCCGSINYNIKLGREWNGMVWWCDDDTWAASLRLVTREWWWLRRLWARGRSLPRWPNRKEPQSVQS